MAYSIKIPINYDDVDGHYLLIKDLKELIHQNLKMLILTNPGERIMDPEFGVGLKKMLFGMKIQFLAEPEYSIADRITSQVKIYMPYVQINDIQVSENDSEENALFVKLEYSVPRINSEDTLTLIFNNN